MPTTTSAAPTDSMSEGEYLTLRAKCFEDRTSVSEVKRKMFEDSVVADIWPALDEKMEKARSAIAIQQSRLDQLEAAAREKADAFIGAINRRDALQATVRLLTERKARLTDNLETQPTFIEMIGNDRARSDADYVESVAFTAKYKTALVQLETLLEQNQSRLVLAEAEVLAFQK